MLTVLRQTLRTIVRSIIIYTTDYILYVPGMLMVLVLVSLFILAIMGRRRREALGRIAARGAMPTAVTARIGRFLRALIMLFSWACMALLLFRYSGIPALDFAKFLGFLFVYLLLPGYLAARRIRNLLTPSALYALSMAAGMALLVCVHVVASYLGRMELIYYINPIVSVIAGIVLLRDIIKHQPVTELFRVDASLLFVVSVVLLYTVTVRSSYAISPEINGVSTTFMDSLYIVTNSVTMKRGLFAESLNFPGFQLRYHVITNILQACAGMVTNISAVNIFMVFWPFLYIGTSVCAIHAVIVQFRQKEEHATMMTLLVLLSEIFTFAMLHPFDGQRMLKDMYMVTANLEAYLLILPNGNDIAIPAILCAALVCLATYREDCRSWYGFCLLVLMTGLATGAKAVYGLCICGALAGTVLLSLFQRNGWRSLKKPALLLLASVIGFAAAYLIFLYNPGQGSATGTSLFSPHDPRSSLKCEALFGWLTEHLKTRFPGTRFSETKVLLIAFPLSVFIILPYVIIPFFAYMIEQLKRFRSITHETMFLCGVAVCGLVGYYVVNFDGYSQAYFLLAAICFIHIIGQTWLEEHCRSFSFSTKAVTALLLSVSMFSTLAVGAARTRETIQAYRHVSLAYRETLPDPWPIYDGINVNEYRAMIWLKENTPEDAVIVCDRFLTAAPNGRSRLAAIDDALYFYYPAYSERQMYLGGYSYSPRTEEMTSWLKDRFNVINKLYSQRTNQRAQIMKENGISYMVVSQFSSPGLSLTKDRSLKCVFWSRDIAIYAIRTP